MVATGYKVCKTKVEEEVFRRHLRNAGFAWANGVSLAIDEASRYSFKPLVLAFDARRKTVRLGGVSDIPIITVDPNLV